MDLLRRRCTSSNHKVSENLIERLMCANSRECCTVLNKHLVLGVGIYKVSSVDQKPKVTAHKQITNQYTSIITWLKPSKREIVHNLSQRNHFKQFINIKRKVTYVSLINSYRKNDPPCSLNRDHGPIGC